MHVSISVQSARGLPACAKHVNFVLWCRGARPRSARTSRGKYLLDEAAGRWGPNLPLFQERLGNEGRKAHVENLYFAYLFVLRAVRKAGPLLERVAFETGMPEADARTQALVSQLVRPWGLKGGQLAN